MIAAEIVRAGMDIPRSSRWAMNAVEVAVPHVVRPIILRDVCSIRRLKSLILNLGSIKNGLERRQRLILEVGASVREPIRVKAEKRAEDADVAQSTVDEILIRASKTIVDHPVEIAFLRDKAHINKVVAFIDNTC